MFRYKLRTLLILLAILPPLLWFGWIRYEAWRAKQDRRRAEAAAAQQQRLLARQILLRVGLPTAAQRAAILKARIAVLEAQLAAQIAAREADDPLALEPERRAQVALQRDSLVEQLQLLRDRMASNQE